MLRENGLPADQLALKIEVIESAPIEREGDAAGVFERLREHGILLAVDDFGTGYFFAYLRRSRLNLHDRFPSLNRG
ncbi:EAL domain-containing protein [Thiocapsa bogorovii]|uniref:EAL domain-containing protein n=1 Tax=Thiocapsa bogorovii TaxID=521689 RepID=UPI001E286F99|nr:EAL domain-containing protein [Thiocapsa bogorovii]UHD17662.1 EAL domain-containing protein [Thiocapsa bogorovii]